MGGLSRVLLDNAAGVILSSPQAFVRIGGAQVAVEGATVAGHGTGAHAAPVFGSGSGSLFVKIGGIPVVLAGSAATCGDTATGSLFVSASG